MAKCNICLKPMLSEWPHVHPDRCVECAVPQSADRDDRLTETCRETSDDRLPEKIEDALNYISGYIETDSARGEWIRNQLTELRAAIRESLDDSRATGYDLGFDAGYQDGRDAE